MLTWGTPLEADPEAVPQAVHYVARIVPVRVSCQSPLPCVGGEQRGHRHEFCSGMVLGRALEVEAQQVGRVLVQL